VPSLRSDLSNTLTSGQSRVRPLQHLGGAVAVRRAPSWPFNLRLTNNRLRAGAHIDRRRGMMRDLSSAEFARPAERDLDGRVLLDDLPGFGALLPEAALFPSDLIGFPRSRPKAPPSEQLDDFLVGSLAEVGIVQADSVERLWRRKKNHLVAFFL
jgi:hypothetical protein